LRDFAPNAAAILLTEPAERWSVRLKVPGLLGDIVIVFVDDDPAALEVAEACPPDFDIGNFQRDPSACGAGS
jgi:hypothetical protein